MKDRDEPISQTPWEIVERSLNDLKKKLDEFEERIGRLERDQAKVIFEETAIAENQGFLGGKTLASVSGSIKKIVRLPVCDSCGQRLGKHFTICSGCGSKLCDRCVITFHAQSFCSNCMLEMLPLTKSDAKVLLCLAYGLMQEDPIAEITGLSRREVRSSKLKLMKLKLMRKKGVSLFSKIELSELGRETVEAIGQIYRKDADFALLEKNLTEKMRRNEVEVQGNNGVRVDSNDLSRVAVGGYRNKLLGY